MNKDNFIGKTYGSYLLIKKLGAGAFGQIYLGKSENDDKTFLGGGQLSRTGGDQSPSRSRLAMHLASRRVLKRPVCPIPDYAL